MNLMQSFDAIQFQADGRPPHVVSLMTCPTSFNNPHAPAQTSMARVPHPKFVGKMVRKQRPRVLLGYRSAIFRDACDRTRTEHIVLMMSKEQY